MAKGKRYKKSGNEKPSTLQKLLLITAILNLIKSIIDLIKEWFK